MSKSNDVTGDRITNALKGDKEAYREGWEAIFGKKDMKRHVQQITGDTPHTVVEVEDLGEATEEELREGAKRSTQRVKNRAEEILDKLTQDNEDMGLYNDYTRKE